LPSPVGYLGLLGPRRRSETLLRDLGAKGVTPTPGQRGRLFAPVGLDLGATEPETIALAIVAEAHAVLAGRAGGSLRDRHGPIHQEPQDRAVAAGAGR
jgi:xanthine/CO dehydrogenase XdhC/CoxF family maturation factor